MNQTKDTHDFFLTGVVIHFMQTLAQAAVNFPAEAKHNWQLYANINVGDNASPEHIA